jgi:hypothetical protein
MKDGKEVELHTWDSPDDPDNPYAKTVIIA